MLNAFFQNLQQQGIPPQAIGDKLPEQMEEFKKRAERISQERALTKAILETAELSVSEDDLKARIEEMLGDETPAEQKETFFASFLQGESKQRLKSQVEYEKVLEFVAGPRPSA